MRRLHTQAGSLPEHVIAAGRLKVLALVPYALERAPGQRYRIEQWAPLLVGHGIDVTFRPFLSPRGMDVVHRPGRLRTKATETAAGYVRRTRDRRSLDRYGLLYVYREAAPLAPASFERWLLDGRRYVYDFDDAIYLAAASPANPWTAAVKAGSKPRQLCRGAIEVIAGNETLAAWARQHTGRPVTVVPSTIDPARYRREDRPPNARPVVGWTGSHTTLAHLESIGPALARLRERHDFELRVIGGTPKLAGVDVRPMDWRPDTEAEDLRGVDVGLMPLPDDEWSRGKCGMKALQYMALAIPPVVSPVGMNARLVVDGVNGLHARDEAEWVSQVGRLLADGELRQRMGAEARRTVERSYLAPVQVPRVAEVLWRAAGH